MVSSGRYAQLLVVQGQYEAAAKEFDRALLVDPNHPGSLQRGDFTV